MSAIDADLRAAARAADTDTFMRLIDAGADSDDFAAPVASRDSGILKFESWDASSDPEVHMVEGGAQGLDHNLARWWGGWVSPVGFEGNIWGDRIGLFLDDDGFHVRV